MFILKLLIKAFVLAVIGFLILILAIYLFTPSRYNILIIGSDQRESAREGEPTIKRGRSDVLMVVSISKKKKDITNILMVPRDTYISDSENGDQKITHYYAMGERYESDVLGNLPLTQEKVEELLGEKMDATFEVTFDGFKEIIDLLGGVETSTGHVDSAAALEMVHNRYVQPRGDFGRAEEQREILQGVIAKVKNFNTAKEVYDFIKGSDQLRLKFNNTKTGCFAVAYLIGHNGKISFSEYEEIELPGENSRINGIYYWQTDSDTVHLTAKKYLR
ncbi:MAG: LCP family protein [Patescibacteria group bacterium]